MEDPAWLARLQKERSQQRIRDFETRARKTGNLLYVWLAIWEAHAGELPMPDWCYGQITDWAASIYEMAHGLDPDKQIKRGETETREEFSQRLEKLWSTRAIGADEALVRANSNFGLSSQGFNAFRNFFDHEEAIRQIHLKTGRDVAKAAGIPIPSGQKKSEINEDSVRRRERRLRAKAKKILSAPPADTK